jgi:endoglucanase
MIAWLVAALAAGACGSTPPPAPAVSAAAPPAPAPRTSILRRKPDKNPFIGAKLWSDPYSQARLQSLRLKSKNPGDAALLEKIADHTGVDWIGDWTPNVETWVDKRVTLATKQGALPILVAYRIPKRDCGQYSAGGASRGQDYREWISAFARGIGARKVVVILEPDGLALLKKCLSPEDQQERLALLWFAVRTFASLPDTWIYVDAGHSHWVPAPEMAERLKAAGIEEADGFALNVSNYRTTEETLAYGKDLSARVAGKRFVIDTSRNGNGPPPSAAGEGSEASWCNPDGRALGSPPTAATADPLCDAYLWIKKPGESDGECNGGPRAGTWWSEQALGLARRARW